MNYKNYFYFILLMVYIPLTTAAPDKSESYHSIHQCYSDKESAGIALLISKKGAIIYQDAIGMADISARKQLQPSSLFQIGSITKQFTATAILLLEEQGKLSIQDPLSKYLPDYPTNGEIITIEQMLSHTSGLPNYLDNPASMTLTEKYAPIDDVIKVLAQDDLIAKPGEKYAYSNTGYVLLGKIIEQVSAMSYADFMQQNIFMPLHLDHTLVITPMNADKIVTGYSQERENGQRLIEPIKVDRSWIFAAGAIASTLDDMNKWQHGLKEGKLISINNYKKMTTAYHLNSGEHINYGLGFDVYPISGKSSISHQGSVPGFFSWAVYFPEEDVYGVALSNNDTNHPGPSLLHMLGKVLNILPELENSPDKQMAEQFVGSYDLGENKVRVISYEKGELFSQKDKNEKRRLVIRKNHSFSFACDSDYFQLIKTENGKVALQYTSLYFGEGDLEIKR